MRILQGWKVKLYTFITVSLFVAGTLAVMWPHNNVAYNKTDMKSDRPIKTHTVTPKPEVKGDETTKDPSASDDLGNSDDQDSASDTGDTADDQSRTTTPSTDKTSKADPKPVPDPTPDPTPKPIIKPVEPPTIIDLPYIPPTKCGGCGQILHVDGIMCPMTTNSVTSYLCRLDQ